MKIRCNWLLLFPLLVVRVLFTYCGKLAYEFVTFGFFDHCEAYGFGLLAAVVCYVCYAGYACE